MLKNVAFIGGGQMAEAFISSILRKGTISAEQIRVVEPVTERAKYLSMTYGIFVSNDLLPVVSKSDIVILCIKPQVMPAVLKGLKNIFGSQLLISIAAGISINFIESGLSRTNIPIVRVMPNMPALIQSAATALCRNSKVSDEDLELCMLLFRNIGKTFVTEEKLLDAVTGLSGSGPAYVFSFIEGLIEAGVKNGLDRRTSRDLTIQTIIGSARMLENSESHPAQLKDMVTTPGGTTASALHVLESSGFKGILISAVEAACNRSIELGKS